VRWVGYSAELETSLSVLLLAIVPKVLNGIQEGVFVAHGRVAYQTMVRFWSSIAYVAAAAWMLGHGYDVPALLRVFVAMEYAVAIAYFLIINHRITRPRHWDNTRPRAPRSGPSCPPVALGDRIASQPQSGATAGTGRRHGPDRRRDAKDVRP
jgi:hypothetical protein